MANRWGDNVKSDSLYFLGAPKSLKIVISAMKLKKTLAPWKKIYDKPRQHTEKQAFPVVIYGCESWTIKKAEHWITDAFSIVVLEKPLDSPLDCEEIKPVHPKGDQSWRFSGRTDAEVPVLWWPDAKNWLFGKDTVAGKDWRQEEKGMTENEMVGWHHRLDEHEFEQALGVVDEQGSLACYSPWYCNVGHDWVTELSWSELMMR